MAEIITYPQQLGTVLPASVEFGIFQRLSPRDSQPKTTVNLYMPEEMVIPSTVRWGNTTLGAIGAGIQGYREGGGWGAAGTAIKAAAVQGAAAGGHRIGEMMASSMNMNYDAQKAGTAASVITGKTLNPYLTAVFEGVDFRTFQFRFRFAPHSEKDCDLIDKVIKTFRMAALPDSGATDAVWDYPDEFQITYKFNKEDHKWLKKFKRCVLYDIDVRYGEGDNWSQHRNGFPTMITMNMTFKEIEMVLRKDVEEGY